MNYKTHRVGGICSGIIASTLLISKDISFNNLLASGIIVYGASIGCCIPDIDKSTSKIGRKPLIKPISLMIQKMFGHRTITHSLIMSLFTSLILLFSTYYVKGPVHFLYSNFIIGCCVGYLSHLLLDSMTVEGIPIFYPFVKKNYRICKFRTGKSEEFVSMLCVLGTGAVIISYFSNFFS